MQVSQPCRLVCEMQLGRRYGLRTRLCCMISGLFNARNSATTSDGSSLKKLISAMSVLPLDGFGSVLPRLMPGILQEIELERHFHYFSKVLVASPTEAYQAHCEGYELIIRSTWLNDVAKIEHTGVHRKSRDHVGGGAPPGENRICDSVEFLAMPDVFQILPEDVFEGFLLG